MKAIFKKELKGYFMSPLGYVFMGVFILLNSFFFVNGPIAYGIADVGSLFSNVNVIFLFLISILTMRLLAEEKNKKTDQLLLTAPVSVTDIVLGKYFAALGVFLITLVVSLVLPITLFIFADPPLGECIGGYIGFILLWAALISVGVFISALTETQMISAVFTFGVLLLINYFDFIASSVSNEFISKLITSLSLFRRYSDFQTGILNIEHVVFFISVVFIFLFFTIRVIEKRRYA